MKFKPFDKMWVQIETQKDISDAAYFNALMYMARMLMKVTVAALVAAVHDGRDRHQYRLKYRLIRAEGYGEWRSVIEEILSGVTAQNHYEGITGSDNEVYQLTKRSTAGDWQHQCVNLLMNCLQVIGQPHTSSRNRRIKGKEWFIVFPELRNKTQGHGAPSSGQLSRICPDLDKSIRLFTENFRLFQRPWAYIAQTLKGKYHVVRWTEEADTLRSLATARGKRFTFPEGVYVLYGDEISSESLRRIDLISSDVDATDVLLPNGHWRNDHYETMSYLSNEKRRLDGTKYLTPITELAPSDTQGLASVLEEGTTIYNMPPKQRGYIERRSPEENLYSQIVGDTPHQIITLFGSGGVGKTWLTLEVLDKVAKSGQYSAILWFSARDIDLLADGAREVKPHILTENDIALEFKHLIGPWLLSAEALNEIDPVRFLQDNLYKSDLGNILYVFDNFETVKDPSVLYNWIYSYLRLPNRALITTRFREFKGDYPVELEGMSIAECTQLISETARQLEIGHLMSRDYIEELYDASNGHPYVLKIMLGEVRKARKPVKPDKLIDKHDDVLNSLFERTYSSLSLVAQHVFLTLCSWRSLVAETTIQAVLLRPGNEMSDVTQAIDDLYYSSLIERNQSESDIETYWSVPLAARLFGQRKLETYRMQMAIRDDLKFLHLFGSTQESDVARGMQPRIRRSLREIEKRVLSGGSSVDEFVPIVESVARQYPDTWLLLADLYKKLGDDGKFERTLERYIESSNLTEEKRTAWEKLVSHFKAKSKYADELFARIRLAQLPDTDYDTISDAVDNFNRIVKHPEFQFEHDDKSQIVQLLILLMEQRDDEADATDFSRLGWLYMHNNQLLEAESAAQRGLILDEHNVHCRRLLQRIRNN